jgi:hypothetical protein
VKLLIDECLHTSLRDIAYAVGHIADHVNYLGLAGLKDWELMSRILEDDYTFVTNNRSDFLALHGKEGLHPEWSSSYPMLLLIFSKSSFAQHSNTSAIGTLPNPLSKSNTHEIGSNAPNTLCRQPQSE